MYINVIEAYRIIIALADENLVGNIFEEDNLQLDIKESFYKGEIKPKKEIIEILKNYAKEDATFNIVGEESIQAAIESGIITKSSVGTIQNIPYAMILL